MKTSKKYNEYLTKQFFKNFPFKFRQSAVELTRAQEVKELYRNFFNLNENMQLSRFINDFQRAMVKSDFNTLAKILEPSFYHKISNSQNIQQKNKCKVCYLQTQFVEEDRLEKFIKSARGIFGMTNSPQKNDNVKFEHTKQGFLKLFLQIINSYFRT